MATLNFFDIMALQPDFFDEADIDERLNRKALSDAILKRCGTLQPIYTDSRMFKYFSNTFFFERATTIKKLIDTTLFEYNPIENYDRVTEFERDATVVADSESTSVNTQTNQQSTEMNRATDSENKVSAFDSDEYVPKQKDDVRQTDKGSANQSGMAETTVKEDGTDTTTEKGTTRSHGNIGVTTTQSLIEQERKIAKFNIYAWLAIEFEQEFFICVS